MTPSDLEIVAARFGHRERLGWLTSDANPDAGTREEYRRLVADLAAGKPPEPPAAYPPVLAQLGTAAKALGRFVASGCETLDADAVEARRAVCRSCEHYDAPAARCRLCGCWTEKKTKMASEHCPQGKWENGAAP